MSEPRDDMAPGDEAPPEENSTGENVCPRCAGSGRVKGETCAECGGSGTIVEAIGGG